MLEFNAGEDPKLPSSTPRFLPSVPHTRESRLGRWWFLGGRACVPPCSARHVVDGSVSWVGDHAAAFADLLTVSETANEPPQDEGNSFNSPRNLAMEATYINHNFSQQCLRMVRR